MAAVAPDGSPVAVFDALPAGPAATYVASVAPPDALILDLGCGAGRLGRELPNRVIGVDVCAAMRPTVCADIRTVAFSRPFDCVVLASYLVNDHDGPAYVAAARRHVSARGTVVVQRFDPLWASLGEDGSTTVGDVTISVHSLRLSGMAFSATVTYTLGSSSWDQAVDAVLLDDDAFGALAADAGLRFDRWLDPYATWARLVPG